MDEIVDINTLFGPLPSASADLSVDALLALMQKHRVGTACTLSTLGLLLDPNIGNAATRAACTEHAELLPVATLNPTFYFGDTDSLARLKTEGFRLARFFPHAQGWPLDYAPFAALVGQAQSANLPIMVSARECGDITVLLRVLASVETPVVLSNVSPDLLPEAMLALRQRANWHLEISRLLAPGCLKTLADNAGADRLLFGTGAPSQPIASALQTLQFAGLPDTAKSQVLAGNARRLLNA